MLRKESLFFNFYKKPDILYSKWTTYVVSCQLSVLPHKQTACRFSEYVASAKDIDVAEFSISASLPTACLRAPQTPAVISKVNKNLLGLTKI